VTGLALYGVAALEHGDAAPLAAATELVVFRDLGAVVGAADYELVAPTARDVAAYRTVIEAVFATRAVLPAPPGVVFRGRDALLRWMELHYVTLTDGLDFIEHRAEARVEVVRTPAPADEEGDELDPAAAATDGFRALRRHAVAALPLRGEHGHAVVMRAAYLVEREHWRTFVDAVAEEGRRRPGIAFHVSGPWPPYDFVRMQLGG
jgi:hypothetical protein